MAECKDAGIEVTGVTKSCLGNTRVGMAMIAAGVSSLGDSRVDNLKSLRKIDPKIPLMMLRTPMRCEAEEIVRQADISLNSDLDTIRSISKQAVCLGRDHEIIIMIETGDMREGIEEQELPSFIRCISESPRLNLAGIGTNVGCARKDTDIYRQVRRLAKIAGSLEQRLNRKDLIISGGNSSVLRYVRNGDLPDEINQLRLGESMLLGVDPVTHEPLDRLFCDAFVIETEIVETRVKGDRLQAIAALGTQDVDPGELSPIAPGLSIRDATSDHLMLDVDGSEAIEVGRKVSFKPGYGSLVRAMTSDLVEKDYR